MKQVLVLGVVAALCASLPGPSLARQGRVVETLPKPRAKPTPSAIPPSPEAMRKRYVERLGGAATCEDFLAVAPVVDDARPLLKVAASQTKGEFETSDEFIQRYTSGLTSALGGAKMLVIRLQLSSDDLVYRADEGLFWISSGTLSTAVDGIPCNQVYCSAYSTVDWDLRDGLADSLTFKVPREAAVTFKKAALLVIGVPLQELKPGMRAWPHRDEFEVSIADGCGVIVSADKAYRAEPASEVYARLRALADPHAPILTPSAPASKPVRITVALGGTDGPEQVVTSEPTGIHCAGAAFQKANAESRQCWMWARSNQPVKLTAQGKGVFGWDWHVAWSGCEPAAEGPVCTVVPTDETVVAAVFSVERRRASPSSALPGDRSRPSCSQARGCD